MMSIHEVLAVLEGVRSAGSDKWVARCPLPSHDDAHPSLSIRLAQDGQKILLRCFGCDGRFSELIKEIAARHAGVR